MEEYVKRNYEKRKSGTAHSKFPVWDYRSRRGSLSASASNSSNDGSSISSISSMRSETEAESVSLSGTSDTDSIMLSDPYRLTIHCLTDSHEIYPMMDIYQPVIDWIDPDLHVVKVAEMTDTNGNTENHLDVYTSHIPSISIMVFLHEEGMLGCERIQGAKRHFERSPWKFHHSEQVARGRVNPYPYNSQDFYYTSDDLPLWAVRQVHYGKEHIRMVVFTSEDNWNDMVRFYKLIIGSEPDLHRNDFCLFTVHTHIHYDIQFALKKLGGETKPRPPYCVKLQFRVPEVGHIVPLFPNVCKPLSDTRWETMDHDGNTIILEVTGCPTPVLEKSLDINRKRSDSSDNSRKSSNSDNSRKSSNSDKSDTSDKTVHLSGFYV
ncbi:protein FAM124A-like isoform X1 [Mytilus trossulus]|uniref:protein FAM124A-like isoform X1 n=2 Tax=Mytilus trossulus TaxID=6551 RepID=UPI003005338D